MHFNISFIYNRPYITFLPPLLEEYQLIMKGLKDGSEFTCSACSDSYNIVSDSIILFWRRSLDHKMHGHACIHAWYSLDSGAHKVGVNLWFNGPTFITYTLSVDGVYTYILMLFYQSLNIAMQCPTKCMQTNINFRQQFTRLYLVCPLIIVFRN